MSEIAKKKERKFLADVGDEFALDVMEQDAQKIKQVTPGFRIEPRIMQIGPNEHRLGEDGPVLHMPLKLNKNMQNSNTHKGEQEE